MADNRELYDVRNAARRVHRSRKTVYRWMNHGLTFREIAGRRYIEHDALLAMYRTKLTNESRSRFGLNNTAAKKVFDFA